MLLAAGDMLENLLGLVGLLVLAIVSQVIKKLTEKRQESEAKQRAETMRQERQRLERSGALPPRPAAQQPPQPIARPADKPRDRNQIPTIGPPVRHTMRTEAYVPPPHRPAVKVRDRKRAVPVTQRQAISVEEEPQGLEDRLERQTAQRTSRLAMAPSPEADTSAIESHLVRIHSVADQRKAAEAKGWSYYAAILKQPGNARKAMILHEILSTPKGLEY